MVRGAWIDSERNIYSGLLKYLYNNLFLINKLYSDTFLTSSWLWFKGFPTSSETNFAIYSVCKSIFSLNLINFSALSSLVSF